MPRASDRCLAALGAVLLAAGAANASPATAACARPVYLTFDTGHMGVAPLIAQVLRDEQVQVTFFAANERTQTGGWSLDDQWAPWWRERAAEGHQLATHTWDHWSWLADHPDGSFDVRPSMGPGAGQRLTVTPAQYCAQLKQPVQRLGAITGQATLPLFRAPGGKTSPNLLRAAQACGFAHVGWADAGFLGDELPSERYPNDALLKKALARIRQGDILVAHLGIWSRRDPWAPAVLKPLIQGLKAKGLCFATLADHPQYRVR
jgi:peptidoglycan-N-acetylmuramic acid deacetylase